MISASARSGLKSLILEHYFICTIRTASKSKLLVGLIYRSPASDELNNEALLNLLQQATERNDVEYVMIVGDMNYPDIDFLNNMVNAGEHAASSNSSKKLRICFYIST